RDGDEHDPKRLAKIIGDAKLSVQDRDQFIYRFPIAALSFASGKSMTGRSLPALFATGTNTILNV
ncbi:MAG: hypothetical protein AAFQ82_28350, partial [Myxococcota bacterium]